MYELQKAKVEENKVNNRTQDLIAVVSLIENIKERFGIHLQAVGGSYGSATLHIYDEKTGQSVPYQMIKQAREELNDKQCTH